ALELQERSLEIRCIVLPSNHTDLAESYDNFGLIYNNMGDCSKALSFLEKALDIRQRIQTSNHPNLADSYNNLGVVYTKMKDYSKALSFLTKGREIRQQMQHPNQSKLADSYNNIAWVHYKMGKYPAAVQYQKRAVEIGEVSLPPNHPQEFLKKSNKSQTNTKQFAFYSYKRNLRKLKSDGASSENSLKILNKIINEFVDEADIWKGDFIDLLINKIDCNYHAHHVIDDYIEDLMNNQFTENIINYLENQYSIKLSVDGNDEVNLNKLIKLNIKIKTKLGCECAFSNHPQPHPP
ncbi:unnamed protein product, partial [Rotaria sordida]